MKTLLLIPSYTKPESNPELAEDCHPVMDYHALAAGLRAEPGAVIEILDYASVDSSTSPAVRLTRKLAGLNSALALMGFMRRHAFDAIFSNAESVAIPLALLFRGARRLGSAARQPTHVTIAHRLSAKKKEPFYRVLKLHRFMDVIFVYSSVQRDFARNRLGIEAERIQLIPFHADHRFFRPLANVRADDEQICSAGLEWRDYPTLLRAVAERKDVVVKLAAASPWSKHKNEVEDVPLPSHVSARAYSYNELRTLYAESSFVVVPLYQNDFQAGVTTILEAMAMGKPVVVTGSKGQGDVIVHDYNGLSVAPGHVQGWKDAIEQLRTDEALRTRLGRAARTWVEENATLDRWVSNVISGLRGDLETQAPPRAVVRTADAASAPS